MESCDPVGTPMEIKDKRDLDQNGTLVDATKYRSMIGALMYLTSSRLDIVHATCLCARYQAKPTEKHLKEVKQIFRYLWGTVNMVLWYTKDSGFELTGFSDADYAGYFKSFANEADASLAKQNALELEIERLLKAVVSKDIMSIVQNESVVDTSDLQTELERTKERFENCIIKKETEYAKLWNDWYKKCDECKYDKISYDKAYKDMQ
nr:uncharacterized mitochondrial protein AtMg00810-like [Tanacetum cinerariifolium]